MATRWIATAASLALVASVVATPALAGGRHKHASGHKHFSGVASFYSKHYRGRTASGQRYNSRKFTAAHRTLPFGTRVRVSRGGRSVIVVVNDRGPFIRRRVIDLSFAAAKALHMVDRGLAKVSAEVE